MMSKAEEERQLYTTKLNQIKQNLIEVHPGLKEKYSKSNQTGLKFARVAYDKIQAQL